jgi:preprotein translocase SecE subunit
MKQLNTKTLNIEIDRITWPTFREVAITSLAVFLIMGMASLILFVIDQLLGYASHLFIG